MAQRHGQITIILSQQRIDHPVKKGQSNIDPSCHLWEKEVNTKERNQPISEDPTNQKQIKNSSGEYREKVNGVKAYPEIHLPQKKSGA